jgi:hypothetical protein
LRIKEQETRLTLHEHDDDYDDDDYEIKYFAVRLIPPPNTAYFTT